MELKAIAQHYFDQAWAKLTVLEKDEFRKYDEMYKRHPYIHFNFLHDECITFLTYLVATTGEPCIIIVGEHCFVELIKRRLEHLFDILFPYKTCLSGADKAVQNFRCTDDVIFYMMSPNSLGKMARTLYADLLVTVNTSKAYSFRHPTICDAKLCVNIDDHHEHQNIMQLFSRPFACVLSYGLRVASLYKYRNWNPLDVRFLEKDQTANSKFFWLALFLLQSCTFGCIEGNVSHYILQRAKASKQST